MDEDNIYPKTREEEEKEEVFTPLGSDIFKRNEKKSSPYHFLFGVW